MWILLNFVGLGMLIVGLVVAYGIALVVGATSSGPALIMLTGSVLFVIDLVYRSRSRQRGPGAGWTIPDQADASRWWYSSKQGGHFVFIPIWIWGVSCMAFGAVGLSTGWY